MPQRILIINGSLGGASGNTGSILQHLAEHLRAESEVTWLHLAEPHTPDSVEPLLRQAHGFVFATGTYWDSWGSPMQSFFEHTTAHEASDVWLGKPAAALVTMHSVGGKGVLSRLQGVLSTLGLLIPPMSGMVYSLAGHLALRETSHDHHDDLWQLGDLATLSANLLAAVSAPKNAWTPWTVDQANPSRKWF